mgnify:CR=1 FL=1
MRKEGGPLQVNQVRLGAVLSYVSMGLSTLISLIYTPIMLGRLGETEYGVYGAVGPIISYLLLLSMGLGSAYIRYYSQAKVAKDRQEMAKLNGMFLVTLSLLGLVLLALGFFLAAHPQMVFGTKWASEELALGAKLLRIMTVNAALSFPFSVFESHVNIHERYLFLKAVTMAKSVLSPLISIPLLLLGFRSPAIATLSLVLTIVCGLTYMAYCFAVLKMPVSFRTYDLPLMKNMMGFTFYIFLAVVVDQLNYGIGTLMTTWIHGAELSGVYYSANQLNVYYLSFAMAISNVLIPRVHRMVAEGDSNRELTRQIETRDAEIVAQSSTLIGRNEIILRLRDMVNEFQQKQGSRTTAPLWQKVNAYVSSKLDTESDWTLFLIKFEQKHSSYFRIMKERFPDLTTSDLRLSACLKMNLCTKEIASLMSLSVRAVENGRYRLRKKLGLTSAQNLNEFLLHIDSQESGPEDDEK